MITKISLSRKLFPPREISAQQKGEDRYTDTEERAGYYQGSEEC